MTSPEQLLAHPFVGSGEVAALARDVDWSATPLGPVHRWPMALRGIVRAAFESPFPINLWCGPELVLIYNDAYRRVLGTKHPAALGRPGPEVWSEIWPEIAPMFTRIREGGPPVYADDASFVVRRAGDAESGDGTGEPNAWFTFSLSPVRDEAGEIVALLNIVAETTDRVVAERARENALARAERAEARLLEVFSQAPAFLAVLRGEDHVFEYVNEAYYQVVGHRELLGRPVLEALPEVRSQGFEKLLDQVLESGEAYVGREVSVLLSRTPGSEPEERFVDFVYYPITEVDGTRTGVVAHGSDVTEHVLARREAQRARTDAEAANQAKSQFLANMSHEIRTPINAIIGYADILELGIAGPVSEQQREHLERVRSSGRHLLGLLNDVLDLAKAEAGRVEVAHERTRVAAAVKAALGLVRPQLDRGGIAVHDSCSGQRDTYYVGDEDRVRQVVTNLLSNAAKFTPAGGEIRIDCGTTSSPDPEAEVPEGEPFTFIRVVDTGIGIEPERLDSIFEPFIQAETGYTRTRGGTGLGLTISRQLARLMGGDLTARSRPGEGSTFTLWLPTRTAPAPVEATLRESAREELPPGLPLVGEVLRSSMNEILGAYAARMASDPLVPGAAGRGRGELEDHASTYLADLAQGLLSLGEGNAEIADLLRDGSEIQLVISRLHGIQRARLGWSDAALEREFVILREEIEAAVRRKVSSQVDDIDAALGVLGRFLDQGERVSRRSLRRALASRPASRPVDEEIR